MAEQFLRSKCWVWLVRLVKHRARAQVPHTHTTTIHPTPVYQQIVPAWSKMATAYPATDEYKPINRTAAAYAVTGQPVPQTAEAAPLVAPPGAPTVGMWVEERYCGLTTWVITLVAGFPCTYFCPCDRRTVWRAEGKKYNEKGATVDDYLFLNPCPPGTVCHPSPSS